MKKWKKILPIVVVILLLLGCFSVDARVNGGYGYNEDEWFAQHKLDINEYQQNKTFSATGEDEAIMTIVIRNKTTDHLETAPLDIEVLLRSEKGIVKPQKVTIFKGKPKSEDISLTSTQVGTAIVIAEAVGFEVATTSVKFTPPPRPCELYLTAHPQKSIPANGRDQTKLTAKLLNAEGEVFIPQANEYVDTATNRGETLPQINISKNKPIGQVNFTTYKAGTVEFIARSLVFGLEGRTEATFVSPINRLTIVLALLGGLVGGFVEYCLKHKKGFVFLPKRKNDGTWDLGIIGPIPHAILGLIMYMVTCLGMDLIPLPIDVWYSVFTIGFIGGFSSDLIPSRWYEKLTEVFGVIKRLRRER